MPSTLLLWCFQLQNLSKIILLLCSTFRMDRGWEDTQIYSVLSYEDIYRLLETQALVCLIIRSYDVLLRHPWNESYSLRDCQGQSSSAEILWALSWALSPALASPLLFLAGLCVWVVGTPSGSQSSPCGHNCYWPAATLDATSCILDETWHQESSHSILVESFLLWSS